LNGIKITLENLCIDGKCKKTRAGLYHEKHDVLNMTDEIEDSTTDGFDDVIIDQTKERITQEFSNISSIETKAGIMITANAVIFTIILSTSTLQMLISKIQQNFYGLIPLAMGIMFFALSFTISLILIIPRKKLEIVDPRTINNELNELPLNEIKRQLRHNLIQSFEELEKERNKELFAIKVSFIFLGIGSFLFIVLYFLPKLTY